MSSKGGGCRISAHERRKTPLPPGFSQLHWMRLTQSGQDLSGLRGRPPRRAIPMAEVCMHNTEEDCWSVLDGKVYNMTPYLRYHPGGIADLMLSAGGDCTDLFNEKHAWVNGHSMLEKCYIGELDPDSIEQSSSSSKFALDPKQWRSFKLIAKRTVNPNVVKFTFELPPKKLLGLEVPGQHLKVRFTIRGKTIERAFTPASKLNQPGGFDLLVKIYPDGLLTSHFDTLPLDSMVEMLGPQGVIGYSSPGVVLRNSVKSQDVKHLVMIAAGTGITPMLQLVRGALESAKDQTKIMLVYCSQSLEHIIALGQLEPLANMFPGRIQIHHVLKNASPNDRNELNSFRICRLDKTLLEELLPEPTSSVAVFHCGPPSFDDAVGVYLRELGFADKQIYLF